MYVQAVGWQLARKDKIDLDGATLHQKAGLYTCPPTVDGQKPFHCCLQIREEPINVRTRFTRRALLLVRYCCTPVSRAVSGNCLCSLMFALLLQVLTREGALMTQPEYVLRFQPPLTISNLLPFDITVVLTDRLVFEVMMQCTSTALLLSGARLSDILCARQCAWHLRSSSPLSSCHICS
jgi:hypothetical protein